MLCLQFIPLPPPPPSFRTWALGWGAKKDSGRGSPSLFGSSLFPLELRGYSWTSSCKTRVEHLLKLCFWSTVTAHKS